NHVNTVDEWDEHLKSANQTNKLVVVDFTAVWCGPCRFIAPILDAIAKKMPQVIFLKVDVDKLKAVAEDWAVEAMPTFIFLKEGKIIDKIVGAQKDALVATINKHAAAAGVATASA
uniref:Thioredoxin domain-containing protein n=1 Tax=Kalanchoe fedtschenkoi TaxID=63787 RepID=A0A7N0SVF4_KALFE